MTLATCRSALDGMQPRYTQTPPGLSSGSTSATVRPRSAARNAAAYPPGPPPTTAILRFDVSDMKGFQPRRALRYTKENLLDRDFLRVPSCPLWFKILVFILEPTAGKVVQTLRKSNAGIAPHQRHRSDGDRRK